MNIRELLENGETDRVEFKSAFGKEMVISMTASFLLVRAAFTAT
jgi:hypothetical protein